MSWTDAWKGIAPKIMEALGEKTATYSRGAGSVSVLAVPEIVTQKTQTISETWLDVAGTVFHLRAAALLIGVLQIEPERGDAIVMAGKTYNVLGYEDDGDNLFLRVICARSPSNVV